MRLRACLLPLLLLMLPQRSASDTAHCVWRVTQRAAPLGELEEALWHEAGSIEVHHMQPPHSMHKLHALSRGAHTHTGGQGGLPH